MPFIPGNDVSTPASKAPLRDGQGKVVTVAATEYVYEPPRPLWSEQHPNLWWDGAVKSIRS